MAGHPLRRSLSPTIFLRGVTAAILCALVWTSLDRMRSTQSLIQSRDAAGFFTETLLRDLEHRMTDVERIAARWESRSGVASEGFQDDAQSYLRAQPGLLSITFADRDHIVRIAVPKEVPGTSGQLVGRRDPRHAQAIDATGATRPTLIAPVPVPPDADQQRFEIIVPLKHQDRFAGTLSLTFDINRWIAHLLDHKGIQYLSGRYSFAVKIGRGTRHADARWGTGRTDLIGLQKTRFLGQAIDVAAHPTGPGAGQSRVGYPEVITVALALLLAILSALDHALRRARDTQRRLGDALADAGNLNRRLEQEVETRRVAEQAAVAAAALKSRFMANMSHEIRTPVNAIMGMFELIGMSDVPDRQRRQAEVGRQAAQRLFSQLNNVLELSQIEARTVELAPDDVSLHGLAQDWALVLAGLIRKSGRPLTSGIEVALETPDTVRIDANRLSQIVTNLMDNAVKYTQTGSVTLRVGPQSQSGAGPGVVIELADTGPGISENDRARVFERYHRSAYARSQFEGGMGLGLNIVQDLVRLMGLTLDLSDTPGGGTTFRISIPPTQTSGLSTDGSRAA